MDNAKPQRDLWIGLGVGMGVALLTYVLLLVMLGLAYLVLLVGLVIISPTPIMFVILGAIALLQVVLGALVATRTTRENRTLTRNLRRAFITSVLLLVIFSPAYICPMMFTFGEGAY